LCVAQAFADDSCPSDPTPSGFFSTSVVDIVNDWPLPDEESIDWYDEYKFRYAPLHTRWLSHPLDEIKGLTTVTTNNTHKQLLISPLGDGSVSIWSPTRHLSRSNPGVITAAAATAQPLTRKSRVSEPGDKIVASVELDRLYIAEESTLVEFSLTTLQTISTTRFPFAISTLPSTMCSQHPLTIGTTLTLHLHDPRTSAAVSSTRLFPPNYTNHAPLFQPSPLSILHHPNDGVFVAGRFPSVLCYDRKMWPKLAGTIHSGGRLCSLAADGHNGLLAGGEYMGRGTLESFSLNPGLHGGKIKQQNRQSAARGKVLAVAKHGTRMVSCDGEGVVSWFERDCRHVVRREEVRDENFVPDENASRLWGMAAEDSGTGPVRKVEVVQCDSGQGLAMWAGDRIGLMMAGDGRSRLRRPEEGDGWDEVCVPTKEELMEAEMLGAVRRALESHADEVRYLGKLRGQM
jgi:hypothetical protein